MKQINTCTSDFQDLIESESIYARDERRLHPRRRDVLAPFGTDWHGFSELCVFSCGWDGRIVGAAIQAMSP